MGGEDVKRKLAAILYADVVGYSRLTGVDEEGTHRTVAEYLDVMAVLIANSGGHVVHYAGDAVLADFTSVVAAVKCAVAAQNDFAERNANIPEDRKVQFRIGINLGDVIVDRDDIYGNGVNVAARLESLADPGGICVSSSVVEQIQGPVELDFQDMGPREVKNIERPVQAYRVVLRTSSPVGPPLISSHKPSIAVLPFDNLSGDTQAAHLADGLVEDLITALAKVSDLLVIGRHSTEIFKGRSISLPDAGKSLGVKYVLQGSIQTSGNRLRCSVQLIDTVRGHHLWAERYDKLIEDIFTVQDEIVWQVLVELQVKLTEGDSARTASRGTHNLEAWLLRVQGASELGQMTRDGAVRARALFEGAHKADPNWARPLGGIAGCDFFEARYGWSASREGSLAHGIEYAKRAIAMDPNEPYSYVVLRGINTLLGNHDEALALIEKAISLAPNDQFVVGIFASQFLWMDDAARAIEVFERAERLGPIFARWHQRLYGLALNLAGRTDKAIAVLEKLAREEPEWSLGLAELAAAYVSVGRTSDAQTTIKKVLEQDPTYTASRHSLDYLFIHNGLAACLRNRLVEAGLPA